MHFAHYIYIYIYIKMGACLIAFYDVVIGRNARIKAARRSRALIARRSKVGRRALSSALECQRFIGRSANNAARHYNCVRSNIDSVGKLHIGRSRLPGGDFANNSRLGPAQTDYFTHFTGRFGGRTVRAESESPEEIRAKLCAGGAFLRESRKQ